MTRTLSSPSDSFSRTRTSSSLVVGMFLPNALLKALAQVKPDQAMAEGSGAVWTMQVSGNHDDGSPFITAMFTYAGGVGARANKPGLNACSYPTGVSAVPIEVVEASAPIRFRRKELRRGSGGAGAQSGGLGQTIEFGVDTTREWQLNAVTSRLADPPQGIFGGRPGAAGSFKVNGQAVTKQEFLRQAVADTQAELAIVDQEETILGYMAKLIALDALALTEAVAADGAVWVDEGQINGLAAAVDYFVPQ